MAPPKKVKKITIVDGVEYFQCDFENCNFKSKYDGAVATHKKDHYEIYVRYSCGACGYDYKTKEFLKQHVEKVYANPNEIIGYVVCKNYSTSNNIFLLCF